MLEIEIFISTSDGQEEEGFIVPDQIDDLEEYYYELMEADKEPFIVHVDGTNSISSGTNIENLIDLFQNNTLEELVVRLMTETDEHVYTIDEIDEVLSGYEPSRIIRMARHGHFRSDNDYFRLDGNGNLESFDDDGLREFQELFVDEALEEYL